MKRPKVFLFAACLLLVATMVLLYQLRNQNLHLRRQQELSLTETAALRNQIEQIDQKLAGLQAENESLQRQFSDLIRVKADLHSADRGPQEQPANTQSVADEARAKLDRFTHYVAGLRNKGMGPNAQPLTPDEIKWLRNSKPFLQELMKDPTAFADLQFTLIQSVLALNDPEKIERVHHRIQSAAEEATSKGLLYSPDPRAESDEWRKARSELDRKATKSVQEALSDSERELFDRRFLGVLILDIIPGEFDPAFQYVPPELGGPVIVP